MTTNNAPITGMLTRLNTNLAVYRTTDDAETANDAAQEIATAAQELLDALQIRAYVPTEDTDDRLEQVVVSLYGVDLSIRGRTDDLFVHVDPDERDSDEAAEFPLTVAVGVDSGTTYGD